MILFSTNFRGKELLWPTAACIVGTLVLLPILAVFYLSVFPEENIWPHLFNTVLPSYINNTLMLMFGVGICSTLMGVGAAWLISSCDFAGRKFMNWALLLPFAVPAYVIAYVYTDLLEYAGPVQQFIRELGGWASPKDYWFPNIRSMGGAIAMMSLVLYPYIYLMAKTAFLEQSPSLFITSRSLGRSAWVSFFLIALPIARPAIIVGLSLVLMETLNDFGTVDYFAVRTLTAGLYDTWLNLSNIGGAAQIALVMLIFVVTLISAERYSRRKQKTYQNRQSTHGSKRIKLKPKASIIAFAACLIPVVLGFVVPAGLLTIYAISYFNVSWTPKFTTHVFNSFSLSVTAALVTLVVGVVLAYAKRIDKGRLSKVMLRVSSLGYALPGAVLAIGVIIPLAATDNFIDDIFRDYFGFSTGLILSGSIFALIYAYSIRFLAISSGAVESSLEKITPNMDLVARSLGYSQSQTLLKVHLPIINRGLLTAVLVVFVDCMKELPATLILRPFNFETLATYVYQYASDELLEQSALAALIIVAVGIIPVILLSRTIDNK